MTKKLFGLEKPSQIIEAIIKGIKNLDNYENFTFEIESYARKDKDNVCYGCVATLALMNVTDEKYINKRILIAEKDNLSNKDLEIYEEIYNLETAINNYREKIPLYLLRYFDVNEDIISKIQGHTSFECYKNDMTDEYKKKKIKQLEKDLALFKKYGI